LRPARLLDLLSEAFCLWASSPRVTPRPRQIATEGGDFLLGRDFHPLVRCTFHGALTLGAHAAQLAEATRGCERLDFPGPSWGSRKACGNLGGSVCAGGRGEWRSTQRSCFEWSPQFRSEVARQETPSDGGQLVGIGSTLSPEACREASALHHRILRLLHR
jgi:hypothetical protein